MVTMIPVQSSSIAEIAYDASQSRLYVRFRNDGKRLYYYVGVPPIVWLGLKECHSKGRYLQTQVIPYFLCQKISDSDLISDGVKAKKIYS
jgi:hypothetical protein